MNEPEAGGNRGDDGFEEDQDDWAETEDEAEDMAPNTDIELILITIDSQ